MAVRLRGKQGIYLSGEVSEWILIIVFFLCVIPPVTNLACRRAIASQCLGHLTPACMFVLCEDCFAHAGHPAKKRARAFERLLREQHSFCDVLRFNATCNLSPVCVWCAHMRPLEPWPPPPCYRRASKRVQHGIHRNHSRATRSLLACCVTGRWWWWCGGKGVNTLACG